MGGPSSSHHPNRRPCHPSVTFSEGSGSGAGTASPSRGQHTRSHGPSPLLPSLSRWTPPTKKQTCSIIHVCKDPASPPTPSGEHLSLLPSLKGVSRVPSPSTPDILSSAPSSQASLKWLSHGLRVAESSTSSVLKLPAASHPSPLLGNISSLGFLDAAHIWFSLSFPGWPFSAQPIHAGTTQDLVLSSIYLLSKVISSSTVLGINNRPQTPKPRSPAPKTLWNSTPTWRRLLDRPTKRYTDSACLKRTLHKLLHLGFLNFSKLHHYLPSSSGQIHLSF